MTSGICILSNISNSYVVLFTKKFFKQIFYFNIWKCWKIEISFLEKISESSCGIILQSVDKFKLCSTNFLTIFTRLLLDNESNVFSQIFRYRVLIWFISFELIFENRPLCIYVYMRVIVWQLQRFVSPKLIKIEAPNFIHSTI